MYVADAEVDELIADLAALPDAAGAVDAGALAVAPSSHLYDLSAPIDCDAQLELYAGAVDTALAEGYVGLRVVADITPLVTDPSRRPGHVRWEQHADRYVAVHPLSPLCIYDTRRVAGIEAIISVHPLQGPAEQPFALYAEHATAAALRGDLDAAVAGTLGDVLAACPSTDTAIDVSGVTFLDGRAAWILHRELTRRRADGQSITVDGASSLVRRVWDICRLDPSFLTPA